MAQTYNQKRNAQLSSQQLVISGKTLQGPQNDFLLPVQSNKIQSSADQYQNLQKISILSQRQKVQGNFFQKRTKKNHVLLTKQAQIVSTAFPAQLNTAITIRETPYSNFELHRTTMQLSQNSVQQTAQQQMNKKSIDRHSDLSQGNKQLVIFENKFQNEKKIYQPIQRESTVYQKSQVQYYEERGPGALIVNSYRLCSPAAQGPLLRKNFVKHEVLQVTQDFTNLKLQVNSVRPLPQTKNILPHIQPRSVSQQRPSNSINPKNPTLGKTDLSYVQYQFSPYKVIQNKMKLIHSYQQQKQEILMMRAEADKFVEKVNQNLTDQNSIQNGKIINSISLKIENIESNLKKYENDINYAKSYLLSTERSRQSRVRTTNSHGSNDRRSYNRQGRESDRSHLRQQAATNRYMQKSSSSLQTVILD